LDLHVVRSLAEATVGCSLDEFSVDFGKAERASMSLQKVRTIRVSVMIEILLATSEMKRFETELK
jgi:hypothetical protein